MYTGRVLFFFFFFFEKDIGRVFSSIYKDNLNECLLATIIIIKIFI